MRTRTIPGSGWPHRGGFDGPKQVVPGFEHHVGGDRTQVLEEPVCRAVGNDGPPLGEDAQLGGGMESESEQIGECQLFCV